MFHNSHAVNIGGSSAQKDNDTKTTTTGLDDTHLDDYLKKSGGDMTGDLNMGSNKIENKAGYIDYKTVEKIPIYEAKSRNKVFNIAKDPFLEVHGLEGIMMYVKPDEINFTESLKTDYLTINNGIVIANRDKLTNVKKQISDRLRSSDRILIEPRVELSATERLRLCTFKGKDGKDTAYTRKESNAQWIELTHDRLDLNKNRIVNLANPVDPQDAATKSYVEKFVTKSYIDAKMKSYVEEKFVTKSYIDAKMKSYVDKVILIRFERRIDYKNIIETLKPKFWISSTFPYGLDDEAFRLKELTGNGMTITNKLKHDLKFSYTSRIQSTATFGKEFTFIIKAKKTDKRSGRLFTAEKGNKVFGWWSTNIKCMYMEGEIYGMNKNKTPQDLDTHTYMVQAKNDVKAFYDEKKMITFTEDGVDTWGKIVLGRPISLPDQYSAYQVYECIGFDKMLTDAQLFDIYDKIHT